MSSDLDETQMRKTSQLCPPYLNTNSYLSQKLEDFIHVTDPNHHKVDHVVDERRLLLSKEELNLEREIIRLIHTGKSETLKPNSLQSVVINEHHICVACREDTDPDYRVWEWHGHIMFNDPENGFTPEYVYGNYFEKTLMKELADEDEQFYEEEEEDDDDDGLLNLGLRGLMDGGNLNNGRIIQFRNMTLSAGSSSVRRGGYVTIFLRATKQGIEPYWIWLCAFVTDLHSIGIIDYLGQSFLGYEQFAKTKDCSP